MDGLHRLSSFWVILRTEDDFEGSGGKFFGVWIFGDGLFIESDGDGESLFGF